MTEALRRHSLDNVTAIVVFLDESGKEQPNSGDANTKGDDDADTEAEQTTDKQSAAAAATGAATTSTTSTTATTSSTVSEETAGNSEPVVDSTGESPDVKKQKTDESEEGDESNCIDESTRGYLSPGSAEKSDGDSGITPIRSGTRMCRRHCIGGVALARERSAMHQRRALWFGADADA